ncbi:MAG: TetM/TetW/TetO/TetS family tetracycline resistance ribosomal protection protein [Clostridia bacterium]|nr:TetM/TetW/TetO/TetS family tetracycline resistance ribosomal protection protein [Clostridia bacterium]
MIHRNIGILAHVDAGKTTLTEQILYHTGVLRAAGSVDAGTTATDSMEIERQRGISVRCATATAVYGQTVLNFIDTPGHVDFAGEVERSIAALDFAVVLVSAVEGVRTHTEHILHALARAGLPYLIFINKIDRAGADIPGVLAEIAAVTAATPPAAATVDTAHPDDISARIPLLLSHMEGVETDAPTVETLSGDAFAAAVTEGLCEINAAAEEAFLNDTALSLSAAEDIFTKEIAACRVTPVLCGSAKCGVGVEELLAFLTRYMPTAEEKKNKDTAEQDLPSGIIFKIEHDKTVGKIAHVRMFGGKIVNRDEVELITPKKQTDTIALQKQKSEEIRTEGALAAKAATAASAAPESDAVDVEEPPNPRGKVIQIRRFTGGKYTDAGAVSAGEIAALCGLSDARAGQFVGSIPACLATSDAYRLAQPYLRVRVTPADSSSEAVPQLAEALEQLSDEEPYIDAKWENGQRDIVINTTGTIQVEVLDSLLQNRYGLKAHFSPPTVIYKETPAREGIAYADYTMPKPCWAVVKFRFEPMPRGYGVSYHGRLPSNQCFYRYQSHIRQSFRDCLKQGLYGWEVTDFRCTLIDGAHHTIHTHPLDFFVCTPMAFMNGLASMGVTLLEPLLSLRVTLPMELAGRVINEVTRMGGDYESPLVRGDTATVNAIVGAAAAMDFPVKLASMSGGRAVLSTTFAGYRECRDGIIHENPRIGVNPLDRSKWILWARGAYQLSQS